MPCAGPSDSELRAMEAHANERKLGKRWYDGEFTENVACAYTAFVRHGTPLPAWAVKWSDEHERKDKARKQAEKNRKEAKEDAEFREYQKLARKFGGRV